MQEGRRRDAKIFLALLAEKADIRVSADLGRLRYMHDTVLGNEQGIKKVAQLVKAFVTLGGHQLQLNSINRDILLDALAHPENHKNLIVCVWGWSGYFVELDEPYQKHILKRTNFFS